MNLCIWILCILGIVILSIAIPAAICCWTIGSLGWWVACTLCVLLSIVVICCTYLQALKIKQSVNADRESERNYKLAQLIIMEMYRNKDPNIPTKDLIEKKRIRLISILDGMKEEIKQGMNEAIR